MGFKRSIKPPTKAQQARQDKLRELGCICCHVDGWPETPAEIHHINDTGRNISQDHTIPLCPYHHRGIGFKSPALGGPSLAESKKAFVSHYGTELELLEKANRLVDSAH